MNFLVPFLKSFLFVTLMHPFLVGCQTKISARPLSEATKSRVLSTKGEYILAPLDEVKITSVGDATFSGIYAISEDGTIQLPLAGNIIIGNNTIASALDVVTKAVSPFLKDPNFSLTLASKKSYRAFFGGEVTRIGMIVLDSQTNLLSAISLAGGLTPYATGRIVVIRKASNGKAKRYAVPYRDLENGIENYDNFYVERGDFIIAE